MSQLPPFVRPQASRADMDCGLVALVVLTGRSYEDVLATAAAGLSPKPHRRGLWMSEVRVISEALGVPLQQKRKRIDWDEDCGIIWASNKEQDRRHFVVLRWGLVFDAETIWTPDVYLSHEQLTPGWILKCAQPAQTSVGT